MGKRLAFTFHHSDPDSGEVTTLLKGTPYSDEVAKLVESNPDAWEEVDDPAPAPVASAVESTTPAPLGDPDDDEPASDATTVTEPPRGGAGSGVDAWSAYAAHHSVEVAEDATRDDIIATLAERGLVEA